MVIEYRINDIDATAEQIWKNYNQFKIWAFYGQMGCGKTTFIHALCTVLQVKDAISSPTFAIINEYYTHIAGTIFHMDWYRLKNEEDAMQSGVEDCLLSGSFCFIEWPEKAPGILPNDVLHLHVEILDDVTRRLTITFD